MFAWIKSLFGFRKNSTDDWLNRLSMMYKDINLKYRDLEIIVSAIVLQNGAPIKIGIEFLSTIMSSNLALKSKWSYDKDGKPSVLTVSIDDSNNSKREVQKEIPI